MEDNAPAAAKDLLLVAALGVGLGSLPLLSVRVLCQKAISRNRIVYLAEDCSGRRR